MYLETRHLKVNSNYLKLKCLKALLDLGHRLTTLSDPDLDNDGLTKVCRTAALRIYETTRGITAAPEWNAREKRALGRKLYKLYRELVHRGILGSSSESATSPGIIDRQQMPKVLNDLRDLSSREIQVLRYIAEGHTTKQIAAILKISVRTAWSHRLRLKAKLGIRDAVALTHYATKSGLVRPEWKHPQTPNLGR
jgi:DNA-binding CsgD family transcriptional regulator